MRTLSELIDLREPAWPMVQEWLRTARNRYQVLDVDKTRSEQVLAALQISSRSALGAIALESGGIWFDHGWLRFLGGGGPRFHHDLASWNGLPSRNAETSVEGALTVAWDVAGGFFAVNQGLFEGDAGDVFYFAPDTLEWENLGIGYSGLLQWAISCDLNEFYSSLRWTSWRDDIAEVSGAHGLQFHPPLYADASRQTRFPRQVPIQELWRVAYDSIDALTLA